MTADRPTIVLLAPHGPGADALPGLLRMHPDVAVVGPDDFEAVDGDAETFPLNTFAPTWTEAPGCADAFAALALAHRGARHIAWRPGYGLEFPHVLAVIEESLPEARVVAWLPDPIAATAARIEALAGVGTGRRDEASPLDIVDACIHRMEDVARFEHRGRWDKYLAEPDELSLVLQSAVYAPALDRYRRHLGADRVHVVDPDGTAALAAFLDVDPEPWHGGASSLRLDRDVEPELRARLGSFLL